MEDNENRLAASSVAERSSLLTAVYDDHVDEVYRFVHRRCRDHALAEDITQETFMTAIRSTDDPSTISIGWLLTVARNRLFDVLRRQDRYRGKLRLVAAGRAEGHQPELVERLRIEAALDKLSVDYRLVLTLHYVDGLTVPALAEHLGRSAKSVEGLLTRARRQMRAELSDDPGATGTGGSHV
jgi:RNA polymerase sigma-70 factor (ECF subfamily)